MKFSIFIFSLCSEIIVIAFLRIEKKTGIQIWHVSDGENGLKKEQFSGILNFKTSETYIVLEMKEKQKHNIYHCSLFYWIGSESSLTKRKRAAGNAALLQTDIFMQIKNARLIFIGREMEGYESEKFCYIFGLPARPKVPKLYRVQGSRGHLISLLPIPFQRFFTNDVFVYDEGNEVTIWIANLDPVSTRTAILLAERIVKVDLQKKDEEVESCISVIDDLLETYYARFFNNFLKKVSTLKWGYYPKHTSTLTDFSIEKFLEERIHLFVWSNESQWMSKIENRPFLLSKLKSSEIYVLKNTLSGNVFIYLGKQAQNTLVKSALTFAESTFLNMANYVSKKCITIVREGEVTPTHFLIHFADELEKLLSIPARSKLFENWLTDNNLKQKIEITEAM